MVALFDSIFHGYPIGSFLLWEHEARAERVTLGHLKIDAPELANAWSVVDGQQRLTALTAGLTPSQDGHRDERFNVYFDASSGKFVIPEKRDEGNPVWIPVNELLDAATLSEMMVTHPFSPGQRRAAFEAGKRIREYQVPIYVIPTSDEDLLREIFHRINQSGKSLTWAEVHDALFSKPGRQPSTVDDVASDLASLGMGRPDEAHLLVAMLATMGLDPTRSLDEHIDRHRDEVARAAPQAMPALRRTFDFLRNRCAVPHVRLLPHWEAVHALARFFHIHPQPHPRNLELLARWAWRGPLTGQDKLDPRTLVRRAVESVVSDESQSVQELLTLVPQHPPDAFEEVDRFDARTATSRLALLGLAALKPANIESGTPLDVAALIEEHDLSAFLRGVTQSSVGRISSAANRFLHPPDRDFLRVAKDRAGKNASDPVLASHAISEAAANSLMADDLETFLMRRGQAVALAVDKLRHRIASWGRGDRPPLSAVLQGKELE